MPSIFYNPDGTRTGLRINARSRRTYHMGGEPRGGLFTEPTKGEKWEMHERARARRDAAASMPSTVAAAASTASAPAASAPAVKKPDGMLVPGRGGSSVWKTSAQLAESKKTKALADARRDAGGTTAGGNGMFGGIMRGVKKGFDAANQFRKTQDRNFSRTRVALEKIHGESTAKGFWADRRDKWRADGSLNQRDPEVERVLNS